MTTASMVSVINALPEDVTAVRCGLFNRAHYPKQLVGLHKLISNVKVAFGYQQELNNDIAAGVLTKKQRLELNAFGSICREGAIPLRMRHVPVGSVLQPGEVGLVVESTDERFPWAPLLFIEEMPLLNLVSMLCTRVLHFKDAWTDLIEESVDDDAQSEEINFKLRCDIDEIAPQDASLAREITFPYFPITLGWSGTLVQSEVSFLLGAGSMWDPWMMKYGRNDLNPRKVAMHSVELLDSLDVKAGQLATFFEKYSDQDCSLGIEFSRGFRWENLPDKFKTAFDLASKTSKTVYLKLTGPDAGGSVALPGRSETIFDSSRFQQKLLSAWVKFITEAHCNPNSKGYLVPPVRLLIPLNLQNQADYRLTEILEAHRISASSVDFYLPSGFRKAVPVGHQNFEYVPIAMKIDDEWKGCGFRPMNPTLFYDKKTGKRFMADPDKMLLAEMMDVVVDMNSHNLPRYSHLQEFLWASGAGNKSLLIRNAQDPLTL